MSSSCALHDKYFSELQTPAHTHTYYSRYYSLIHRTEKLIHVNCNVCQFILNKCCSQPKSSINNLHSAQTLELDLLCEFVSVKVDDETGLGNAVQGLHTRNQTPESQVPELKAPVLQG